MKHEKITQEFIDYMKDKELRHLMERALEKAKTKNPDPVTNPAQNLEDFYDFIDWACKCLPWNVLKNAKFSNLYTDINQSINYFWFVFGQRLDELKDKGYYLPTLEYHEPIASWIRDFSDAWGEFLSTEESWNDEYFKLQFTDNLFGMNKGWYSTENIWKTYNEFFSRKLISPDVRPIGDAELVSPADSAPDGIWQIHDNGYTEGSVTIKAHKVYQVDDLLPKKSKYRGIFNGGTLTHTFLNVFDYHRYHFPIDGTILEMGKIKAANAVGGHTYYNPNNNRYCLDCSDTNWQMVETRDYVILDTPYGIVACLPIGMSQICSCNFEKNLKVGSTVKKGDPMGYFLFGGSDIVIMFEKGIKVKMLCTPKKHILMGENYAKLSKKK